MKKHKDEDWWVRLPFTQYIQMEIMIKYYNLYYKIKFSLHEKLKEKE